jgi:polyphenol oxidase
MDLINPNWPAPSTIRALTTTRNKGNLAKHVGDSIDNVTQNRLALVRTLKLPTEPVWLEQTHSTDVINIDDYTALTPPIADAAIATKPHRVCVVMTADCLPILLCNRGGTQVAAIHAGWRGLANGIIERTVQRLTNDPTELLAWLGPAIGPTKFEVSQDVLQHFTGQASEAAQAFTQKPGSLEKWYADLYLLSKQRLSSIGVTEVYGGDYCTYSDEKNFYSYRRDGGITGRMATLIWLSS